MLQILFQGIYGRVSTKKLIGNIDKHKLNPENLEKSGKLKILQHWFIYMKQFPFLPPKVDLQEQVQQNYVYQTIDLMASSIMLNYNGFK